MLPIVASASVRAHDGLPLMNPLALGDLDAVRAAAAQAGFEVRAERRTLPGGTTTFGFGVWALRRAAA